LDEGYGEGMVTARVRALFGEAVRFHTGVGEAFYPCGGVNAGYAGDVRMGFEERMRVIQGLLRGNKRIVMDVIEGRGVRSLVANPEGYDKRKQSNNECNEVKKEMMDVGKEVQAVEGKKRKRKRKRGDDDDYDDDDDEGMEVGGLSSAAPSRRRRRRGRRTGRERTVREEAQAEVDEVEEESWKDAELRARLQEALRDARRM
jgi:hypothetical protein